MRRLAWLFLLLLCGPASAAFAPDVVNTTDSNATLRNIPISAAPKILRLGFAAAFDVKQPLLFRASNAPCPLNGGNGDGGGQVRSGDGKCWLAQWPWSVIDPQQFGADGTGVNDASAAIQAAIAAAGPLKGTVILPCGSYKIGTALTIAANNMSFGGVGGGCVYLVSSSATINVLTVTGSYVKVHDLQFASTPVRTAGSYLSLLGTGGRLYDSVFLGAFIGLTMSATDLYIDRNWFLNTVAATGKSIVVSATTTSAYRIGYTYAQAPTGSQPLAGVWVDNAGDLSFAAGSQFLSQGTGLMVVPGNGQSVFSLASSGPLYFDGSGSRGMDLCPTGTGTIGRSRFSGLWASSAGGNGIRTCAGVNGLDLIDPHIVLNGSNGMAITGGSNINVTGGQCAQNTGYCATVSANVSYFSFTNMMVGAVGGLNANTTGGFQVAAGTSNFYQITNNLFNTQTLPITDGGTGIAKTVDGVWNTYTPTLACGTGSLASSTGGGRYKPSLADKTVFLEIAMTITGVGSCAASITASLPVGMNAGAASVMAGRENANTGKMLQGNMAASATALGISFYDNTFPVAANNVLWLSGVFERQ